MERWATVGEFPEYQVSDLGRVRRMRSRLKGDGIIKAVAGKYRRAAFCRDGKIYRRSIPRTMLEAFVGPPPSDIHQAAHNDGDTKNDRLTNLRWATPKENCADRVAHGTLSQGERHGRAKLTAEQVVEIRSRRGRGESLTAMAREFGVCHATISFAVSGETWKSL